MNYKTLISYRESNWKTNRYLFASRRKKYVHSCVAKRRTNALSVVLTDAMLSTVLPGLTSRKRLQQQLRQRQQLRLLRHLRQCRLLQHAGRLEPAVIWQRLRRRLQRRLRRRARRRLPGLIPASGRSALQAPGLRDQPWDRRHANHFLNRVRVVLCRVVSNSRSDKAEWYIGVFWACGPLWCFSGALKCRGHV